jgi:hypothetical protein
MDSEAGPRAGTTEIGFDIGVETVFDIGFDTVFDIGVETVFDIGFDTVERESKCQAIMYSEH